MSLKSQINTQAAEKLINEGWQFKSFKNPYFHFNSWVANVKNNRAKYLSPMVYKNLIKKGYQCEEVIEKTMKEQKEREHKKRLGGKK